MTVVVLTGAALIREREHGTVEHLLVMPVTPTEIMLSKIWSMGVVVLVVAMLSLMVVIRGVLAMPTHGSIPLFAFRRNRSMSPSTVGDVTLGSRTQDPYSFRLKPFLFCETPPFWCVSQNLLFWGRFRGCRFS